jgi:hypothetical protein
MDSIAEPVHYMPDASRLATIRQRIGEYNAERPAIMKTAYVQVVLFMGGYAAVVLFVFYLLLSSDNPSKHNPLTWVLVGLVVAGWYIWSFAWKPVTDHQLGLRYRLFPVIFGFIDKVQYSNGHTPGFLNAVKQMKLVQFGSSENDDLVGGTHDGLDFEMVESKLNVGSGKNKTTVFRGLIFHFTRDDEFPGLLVAAKRGNRFQEWLQDLFSSHDDTIPTGDPDLDATYEIRTDNHSAARPLVGGPLASALKHLQREWWAGDARIALRGREVFLLLPSDRDYFALPSIQQDIDYKADIEPMIRDMVTLLAVAHMIRRLG